MSPGAQQHIGVAVVHPHPLVRLGLRTALPAAGLHVLVEVDGPAELAAAWCAGVQVALVHVAVPVQPVVDALHWLRQRQVPAVVLGPLTDPLADRLVAAGAVGLLPCTVQVGEVVQALAVAARGGLHANAWMLQRLRAAKGRAPRALPTTLHLTRREQEVLHLLAHPQQPALAQIGARLGMGLRTVETHRDALHHKFNVKRRAELVEKARAWGMA